MKVILTSGIFPPDIGVPASYDPKILKSLTERGHDVIISKSKRLPNFSGSIKKCHDYHICTL